VELPNSTIGTKRFTLELRLSRTGGRVDINDPTLISNAILDQAWNMMNEFVMDTLDKLGEELTDEEYRARFIEICYRLIYREMFTLFIMPYWEKSDLERLGTRKTGVRMTRKKLGSYDDDWGSV
jgi:hypothetical protein